jgi:nicotinamidase-related amidase
MENVQKKHYCPTCNGELEMLSGCGAVGYFCNHCRKLVSRSKMLDKPATDFTNGLLLVIDMQTGLLARDVWNKEAVIQNINKLVDFFHQKDMPVAFARHTNTSFSKADTPDWQICDCMHTLPEDTIINKTKSSIFSENAFTDHLKKHGITKIFVTGLVSNGCVQAACLDGLKNGLQVVLVEDGHSTFHKGQATMVEQWNKTLSEQGVMVIPTDSILT